MNRQQLQAVLAMILIGAGTLILATSGSFILARDTLIGHVLTRYRSLNHRPELPAREQRFVLAHTGLPPRFSSLGTILLYQPDQEAGLEQLARFAIRYTLYRDLREFIAEIRNANGIEGTTLAPGKPVIIPGSVPAVLPEIPRYANPPFTRGIYLNVAAAGRRTLINSFPELKKIGINAIVFDAKDIPGRLSYRSSVPLARSIGADSSPTIDNLHHLVRAMREAGIYSIVRLAVFRDDQLAKSNPRYAITSKRTGGLFNAAGEIWCDPTNTDVQDYNIALALELAKTGVDEIQLDYIRFPTGGDFSEARFADPEAEKNRVETITAFLARMKKALAGEKVFLSIDIFGIVAWGKDVDIRSTGQEIGKLARHCDVISPMLYPSHFNDGFENHPKPGDAPYYFIHRGTERVMALAGRNILVRPWLQAFPWKVSRYNPGYILEQIRASNDAGGYGYLFWNAGSDFATVYEALGQVNRK